MPENMNSMEKNMDLNKEKWNAVSYCSFKQYLKSIAQKKNAQFSARIIPGAENILGVRVPMLRTAAKEIAKGDWAGFLIQAQDNTLEEVMIQGIIIGKANIKIEEVIKMSIDYLPKINNWALCDCFCASLKIVAKSKDEFLPFLKACLASDEQYTIRFAVVMLLNYYVEEKYICYILETLNNIHHDSYYIRMSVAWAISVCYNKFKNETIALLMENDLDDFTFNKAIDKITDSHRVPALEKNNLKKLKRGKRVDAYD